jgi:hypothetical protein
MQIFIHRNGEQLGPFTEAEIKSQLAAGTISLQDNVWWEGQAGWVPLGQTPYASSGTSVTSAVPNVPYASGAVAPSSKLAVWALVCGCLGLFLSLLTSIPAIILGHMSLSEIKKNPGMQGRGMALGGLILGYIFTILLPLISVIAISILIALGNQVKDTFKTINSQLAAAQAADTTNSANPNSTNSDTTPAPNAPDQSTNSAPATPAPTPSSSSSTNSPDTSTNAAPATTNAPPMNQ